MGHKVSKISNDDLRHRHKHRQTVAVAALALVIAVQYVSASTTSCAFSTPSSSRKKVPSSLFASASIASAVIASVPPPGSKLYQLRGQRRSSSDVPSSVGKRGRTDLRYATYADSSSSNPTTSDSDMSNHMVQSTTELPLNLSSTSSYVNSTRSEQPVRKRMRRRMLKYLNSEFARLDIKNKSLASPSANITDYQQRKAEWAAKYTSLSTLRSTFGSNKNRFWGDFDPVTTRKLYHTLIPRALLALHDMGLSDVDELAPLAYQARVAAKKYARERSRLPGRIGSMVYDGWRQWRRYGKWKFDGMTWEQIWDKYENQVLKETVGENGWAFGENDMGIQPQRQLQLNDEDLTAKICLRILERSVVTNEMIDKLFLERLYGEKTDEEDSIGEDDSSSLGRKQRRHERRRQRSDQIQADLRAIEKKFDDDIRELLRHGGLTTHEGDLRRKSRSSGSFFWSRDESTSTNNEDMESDSIGSTLPFTRGGGVEQIDITVEMSSSTDASVEMEDGEASFSKRVNNRIPRRKLAVHEVSALRILASTRRRIASLQKAQEDEDNSSRQ